MLLCYNSMAITSIYPFVDDHLIAKLGCRDFLMFSSFQGFMHIHTLWRARDDVKTLITMKTIGCRNEYEEHDQYNG